MTSDEVDDPRSSPMGLLLVPTGWKEQAPFDTFVIRDFIPIPTAALLPPTLASSEKGRASSWSIVERVQGGGDSAMATDAGRSSLWQQVRVNLRS